MKSLRVSLAALTLLAVSASIAAAEPVTYKIDRSHSEVGFKVRHFFSKTPGRFTEYDGSIQLDDKNLANSAVDVTIQTASITTNHENRDKHLRSEDFFSAEKHPTITFKSTKVVPGEGGHFKIHGDLTMRGISKPVVLDAELVGAGALAIGGKARGTRAGFEAKTVVNRKDWEIVWNQTLDQGGTMLDDNVTIELQVEAIKVEPKQEEAKSAPAAASTDKK